MVVLLQIKVGQGTIEEHTTRWLHSSPLIIPLYDVANGGSAFLQDIWVKISGNVSRQVNEAPLTGARKAMLNKAQEKNTKILNNLRSQWEEEESDRNMDSEATMGY